MNNLLAAIMTKISGSALSTAVGGRVYESVAPEGTEFPYVVVSVVADAPIDTFKDLLEDITIQFSLYSISMGLAEITGLFANLKTLFDNATLTISGSTNILTARVGLATMFDDITTPAGTVGLRHWAIDYWIITQVSA